MSEHDEHEKAVEEAALVLLTSTEKLIEAVAEGAEAEVLAEVYSGREAAFVIFRDAVEVAGGPKSAPISAHSRDCLQRVASFDADLIAVGATLVDALRDEKKSLGQARSAIQKHSVREREQPRVLTIKA
jgi:hypothetical protein